MKAQDIFMCYLPNLVCLTVCYDKIKTVATSVKNQVPLYKLVVKSQKENCEVMAVNTGYTFGRPLYCRYPCNK